MHCQDVQMLCRTCTANIKSTKKINGKYNIYENINIVDWLQQNSLVNTDEKERLPSYICEMCFNELQSYFKFKAKTMKSLNTFLEILNKCETTENEPKYNRTANSLIGNDLKINGTIKEINNIEVMTNTAPIILDSQKLKMEIEDDNILNEKSENYFAPETYLEESQDNDNSTIVEFEIMKIATTSNECNISEANKFFKCPQCERRCRNAENLNAHLRVHDGLKPFQCTQCERSFNKSNHLRVHIRETHSNIVEEFMCLHDGCGKIFHRQASFKVHQRLKHSTNLQDNQTKRFICEDCGHTFGNITRLREHQYTHSPKEDYPHHCKHCNKRFTSMRHYKEHLLRHAGIKKYECPYCGMKKTTQGELRVHINYHTKEKQWKCDICSSVFNSSANLGLHKRIVHKGIRRFTCRFCNESFGKPDTLKHHEMRHTGEKPHKCDICDKRFIQIVALRAHLKTHEKKKESASLK